MGLPLPDQEPRWTRPGFAAAVAGLVVLALERGRLLARTLETESLRRSDDLKTALLRTISHELRTPLTAVRTAGEALAGSLGAADERALAEVIQSESQRLERLIANLLDLSRLEAGALGPRVDWCDPVSWRRARSRRPRRSWTDSRWRRGWPMASRWCAPTLFSASGSS